MNAELQPELGFTTLAPKVGPEDVTWFLRVLEQQAVWITAAELFDRYGSAREGMEGFKRRLRAIAEHSDCEIISSVRGYMLLKSATAEDIKMATEPWFSQARKMTDRANRTLNAWHRLPGRTREELATA